MPRISKKHARQRRPLSVTQVYALATGHDFFGEWRAPGEDPDADSRTMREAWGDLGPALTAFHVQQYPATRPYGWWEFEAPERRRRVDGKRHPFEDPTYPEERKHSSYGHPGVLWLPDHFAAVYECSCIYLARQHLLTLPEKRVVQSPDRACAEEETDQPDHPHLTLEQVKTWWREAQR